MKTKFYLLGLLLASVITVSAQNESHFGLKAGMNLSGLSQMNRGDDQGMRMAFGAGFFFNREISEKNSVHVDLLYNLQGAEVEFDNRADEYFRMDYLTIPVSYRHHFKKNRAFSVQFGVQPSFIINQQIKAFSVDSEVFDFDEYFEMRGEDIRLNKFDVGLQAGLGFGFGMFSSINLTFTQGLLDTFKGADAPKGIKNYVFQLGLCLPLSSNTY